jgi:hypothetical protein
MTGRYAIIAGQGRSGTNWLHEILDYSPRTHCRNEPNELTGSAFSALPCGWPVGLDLEGVWDETVRRSTHSLGERDPMLRVRKNHYRGVAQGLGLVRALQGVRTRHYLGYVAPVYRRAEWPVPAWAAAPSALDRATTVLKLNQVPGWAVWALRNRPEARVLHIVRHPGGFLNSYINRWLSLQDDHNKVLSDNRRRLVMVAASAPEWGERFGDVGTMSLLEAELWFWCFAAEAIDEAGRGNPSYQLIIYEDLARDPIGVARAVYRTCDLPWDEPVERAVRASSGESKAISSSWRKKLTPEQVGLVEKILAATAFREYWPEPSREAVPTQV